VNVEPCAGLLESTADGPWREIDTTMADEPGLVRAEDEAIPMEGGEFQVEPHVHPLGAVRVQGVLGADRSSRRENSSHTGATLRNASSPITSRIVLPSISEVSSPSW